MVYLVYSLMTKEYVKWLRSIYKMRNPVAKSIIIALYAHNFNMKKGIILMAAFLLACQLPYAQGNRYVNTTTMGVLAGSSTNLHEAPLSFISEHHLRLGRIMSAGLMTGIEQLNENTMPVALSCRIFVPSGGFRVFAGAYSGYSVALEKPQFEGIKKSRGGFLAGTETGAMIRINDCASLIIGLGYRYSELHYNLEDWWVGSYKRKFKFNRFSIRLGIVI